MSQTSHSRKEFCHAIEAAFVPGLGRRGGTSNDTLVVVRTESLALYLTRTRTIRPAQMSSAWKSGSESALEEVTRLPIRSSADVVTARQAGRELAMHIGFTGSEVTVVAAAISEIARN